MFTVDLDMTQFQEELRQTIRQMENAVVQAVKLADYFLDVIRERTPERSGDTKASWTIHIHKFGHGGDILWEINPDGKEDEVTWLEFGTKDHVIEGNPLLAFHWDKLDKDVVFHRVHHPGTKPLGFVRLTQDDLEKSSKEIADKLVRQITAIWS